jgi:hypothetical protein
MNHVIAYTWRKFTKSKKIYSAKQLAALQARKTGKKALRGMLRWSGYLAQFWVFGLGYGAKGLSLLCPQIFKASVTYRRTAIEERVQGEQTRKLWMVYLSVHGVYTGFEGGDAKLTANSWSPGVQRKIRPYDLFSLRLPLFWILTYLPYLSQPLSRLIISARHSPQSTDYPFYNYSPLKSSRIQCFKRYIAPCLFACNHKGALEPHPSILYSLVSRCSHPKS